MSTHTSPWLTEKRRLNLDRIRSGSMPPRGLHLWRYTDPSTLQSLTTAGNASVSPSAENTVQALHAQLATAQLSAVAFDRAGKNIEVVRNAVALPADVKILSLSDALRDQADLLEKYLYDLIGHESGHFEAENGAHWEDGIFVSIPAKCDVTLPIHLVHDAGCGGAVYPRTLILIGQESRVTIVDEYTGGAVHAGPANAAPSSSNGVVEIFAGANSHVTYVTLGRQTTGVKSYLSHRARIDTDAVMTTVPIALGGILSKQNFGVILNGANAESTMVGLLYGTGHQAFDNHTLHHHAVGQTRSNIDFKVVLQDKSSSAYTGLIRIDKNAKVCEAYQENRNLLLNAGARAQTIPELEILNEEVACTHGATVGPLDPQMIFYLTSRGIDRDEAVRMIVRGYFATTMSMLPEKLRETVISVVESRLAGN